MSSLITPLRYSETEMPSRLESIPTVSGPRIRFSGLAVIASVSTALALATASECHFRFLPAFAPLRCGALVVVGLDRQRYLETWTATAFGPTLLPRRRL